MSLTAEMLPAAPVAPPEAPTVDPVAEILDNFGIEDAVLRENVIALAAADSKLAGEHVEGGRWHGINRFGPKGQKTRENELRDAHRDVRDTVHGLTNEHGEELTTLEKIQLIAAANKAATQLQLEAAPERAGMLARLYDKVLVMHGREGILKKGAKFLLKTALAVGASMVVPGAGVGLAELDSLAKRAVGRTKQGIQARMAAKDRIVDVNLTAATEAVGELPIYDEDDSNSVFAHNRVVNATSREISAGHVKSGGDARRSKRMKRNIGLGVGVAAALGGEVLGNFLASDAPDASGEAAGADSGEAADEAGKVGARAAELQITDAQADVIERALIEQGLENGDVSEIPGLQGEADPFANNDALAKAIESDPGKYFWNEMKNVFGYSEEEMVKMFESKDGVLTKLDAAGVDVKLFGDVNGLDITGDTYGIKGMVAPEGGLHIVDADGVLHSFKEGAMSRGDYGTAMHYLFDGGNTVTPAEAVDYLTVDADVTPAGLNQLVEYGVKDVASIHDQLAVSAEGNVVDPNTGLTDNQEVALDLRVNQEYAQIYAAAPDAYQEAMVHQLANAMHVNAANEDLMRAWIDQLVKEELALAA